MPSDRDARRAAAAAHLSAILVAAVIVVISRSALVAVIVSPAGPLVVALLTRRAQPFVSRHAREAVRFCLSVSFYATGVALGLAAAALFDAVEGLYPLLLFVAIFLVLGWLSFLVVATSHALRGRDWRYPFTIGRRRRATSP